MEVRAPQPDAGPTAGRCRGQTPSPQRPSRWCHRWLRPLCSTGYRPRIFRGRLWSWDPGPLPTASLRRVRDLSLPSAGDSSDSGGGLDDAGDSGDCRGSSPSRLPSLPVLPRPRRSRANAWLALVSALCTGEVRLLGKASEPALVPAFLSAPCLSDACSVPVTAVPRALDSQHGCDGHFCPLKPPRLGARLSLWRNPGHPDRHRRPKGSPVSGISLPLLRIGGSAGRRV